MGSTYSKQKTSHVKLSPHIKPGMNVVAMFNYEATFPRAISFMKGDLLKIIKIETDEWCTALHRSHREEGFIPIKYVAQQGSLYSKDWFFADISKLEAENFLNGSKNQNGTYMVRYSERKQKEFRLSVRCHSQGNSVKHYKIKSNYKREYYIFKTKIFKSLVDLVNYYTKHKDELDTHLIKVCHREPPALWDLTAEPKWEIPSHELVLTEKIGSGNFGEIWYGKWNRNTEVAIKINKSNNDASRNAFLEEAHIMKNNRHNRLVVLYGVCSKETEVYIVTEYMKNGDLLAYLKKHGPNTIRFPHLVYIAFQIVDGMCFLESKNLVHRDLAARNILVGENNMVKIGDFGLTKLLNDNCRDTTCEMFPVRWSAPEILKFSGNFYSTKSDVWSFGILMTEIFTYGKTPYGEWTNDFIIIQVMEGYRMPNPDVKIIPKELWIEIEKCWEFRAINRPSFNYYYDFFTNYAVAIEGQYSA